MSLLYTDEQKALLALVREMAENEIKPHVKDADEKGECPRELFQWGFDMGLHMLEIPEEYGGTGLSYETTAMIFEELAKVDAGYAITFVTTFVALRNVILEMCIRDRIKSLKFSVSEGFKLFCIWRAMPCYSGISMVWFSLI